LSWLLEKTNKKMKQAINAFCTFAAKEKTF